MAEYIERDSALAFQNELEPMVCKSIMTDELFSATKDSDLVAFLKNIPAADVVSRDCYDRLLAENDELRKVRPIVRGKWKIAMLDHEAFGERPRVYYCSVCNQIVTFRTFFCPNCGADMRGDDDG